MACGVNMQILMKGGGFMSTDSTDSCRCNKGADVPPRLCTIKLNKEDFLCHRNSKRMPGQKR